MNQNQTKEHHTLTEMFESSCITYECYPAIICNDAIVSYAKMGELSRNIAAWLQNEAFFTRGDCIAIMLPLYFIVTTPWSNNSKTQYSNTPNKFENNLYFFNKITKKQEHRVMLYHRLKYKTNYNVEVRLKKCRWLSSNPLAASLNESGNTLSGTG